MYKHLITNLSRYFSDTIGKGFLETNLKNIREFYVVFSDFEQFDTWCVANLTWTNILTIIHLDNKDEIVYYLKESSNFIGVDLYQCY